MKEMAKEKDRLIRNLKAAYEERGVIITQLKKEGWT